VFLEDGAYSRALSQTSDTTERGMAWHTSMIEIEIPAAKNITVTEDTLRVDLSDGRTISVPLAWVPKIMIRPLNSFKRHIYIRILEVRSKRAWIILQHQHMIIDSGM